MILKNFHKSFHDFIFQSLIFSEKETSEIHAVFEKEMIKVFFNVVITLFIWGVIASWIGSLLASKGIISILQNPSEISHFLPFLIFYITNNLLQFIFIYNRTRKFIKIPIYQIIIGTIPFLGAIFILGVFLAKESLFFKALKEYLSHIKKEKRWLKLIKTIIKKDTK